MSNLKPRERVMIVLCILVVLVGAWMLLNPAPGPAGQQALLPVAEAEHQTDLAQRTVKRLSSEQEEMTPRLAALSYDVPPDQLAPRLVRDLQKIADRTGVHLREIKPQRPRDLPGGNGARLAMEVRFSAPFQPNVVHFLYEVEDPQGKMVVDKLSVSKMDNRYNAVDVTAQISVFTRNVGTATTTGEQPNASSAVPQG